MLKLKDLKEGNYVLAEYEGRRERGVVKELNREDQEICVETPVQEFWFKPGDLYGIPLNDEEMIRLGFERQELEDGKVKYLKGPFRALVNSKDDFSHIEIWYREDHRHPTPQLYVHELQQHYLQMTKVDLVRDEQVNEPL